MLNVEQEELKKILAQLDQALYNHNQWHEALQRTLICRLPYDRHDVAEDAHRQCRFGQWYYNMAPKKLVGHSGYIALGDAHERMHKLAMSLFMAAADGAPLSMLDYDNFANSLAALRLQIHTLKHELEDMLYNCDQLTGASNRVGMLTKLRELRLLKERGVETCAIAMMDLDHFKGINDAYGHLAGDRVLSASARYVMDSIRQYDKLYRYGGEEFIILMQGLEPKSAFEVVERLREGLAENQVVGARFEKLRVTASFGIASLDPEITVEQSIERADTAMFAAKESGRNCTRIWTPFMVKPERLRT